MEASSISNSLSHCRSLPSTFLAELKRLKMKGIVQMIYTAGARRWVFQLIGLKTFFKGDEKYLIFVSLSVKNL